MTGSSDMPNLATLFAIITEVGIIDQLAGTVLANRLQAPMTAAQFRVMTHLTRLGNGQTPKQIASAFQVPNTSMSHTIALLARNRFVTLQPHEQDKRSKTLWLTDRGRQAHRDALALISQDLMHLGDILNGAELATLQNLLARIRVQMDTHRPEQY